MTQIKQTFTDNSVLHEFLTCSHLSRLYHPCAKEKNPFELRFIALFRDQQCKSNSKEAKRWKMQNKSLYP